MQNDNVIRFARKPQGPKDKQPFLNLPPFTTILAGTLLLIHLVLSNLDEPTQYWVMEHFGFIPAYYTGKLPFAWPALAGPITFTLIHGSWMHVLMNTIMLVAFGAGLEPWMGWKRLAVLMIVCNFAALIGQALFSFGSTDPVIGASGALSGLFAAAIIMMQERAGAARPAGKYGYWPFIIIWIGTSVLFGIIGGPQGEVVAWPAHIGGFLTGFALYKPIMALGTRR